MREKAIVMWLVLALARGSDVLSVDLLIVTSERQESCEKFFFDTTHDSWTIDSDF